MHALLPGTEKLVRYDVHNDCVHRDPAGRCVPAEVGEAGEAIVRLDGPYSGYTSAEATERVLYRDVFEAGDCWYHSGDLLRYDEWGFCYFVDRAGACGQQRRHQRLMHLTRLTRLTHLTRLTRRRR